MDTRTEGLEGELEERRKELALLHKAASLLLDKGADEGAGALAELANLIPSAFRQPERTAARICLDGAVFGTASFRDDASVLCAPLSGAKCGEGCIEVAAAGFEGVAFLDEEEALLRSLARFVEALLRQRRSDVQLRESERRFRALFDNEVDCVKVLDAERRLVEMNPAGVAILGLESSCPVAGELLDSHIHPDDLSEYRRLHREAMQGRTARGRYRIIGGRGEIRFLESVNMPLPTEGGTLQVLSITSDLTRLMREEEKFRHVLDSSPDAMIITDANGIIRVVNRTCESLFGYTRYELIGQPVEMLMPDRLRDEHRQHRAQYARKPRIRAMGMGLNLKARRKNGSEFPVEIALGPVYTGGETLTCATVRDMTGVREFESALRELADSVSSLTGQAYLEALARFLSSHFGLDVALVGVIEDGESVRSLAVADDGNNTANFTYPLKGTPCDRAIREDRCFHPERVQQLYPDDAWFRQVDAHGYAGVRLHDDGGKTIGVISAISRRPLPNILAVESFLKLAAARASAEIDRMRKIAEVQESALRYSLAESGTADGLWDMDMETRRVYYSPRVSELLGVSEAELQDNPEIFWSRVHPDDVLAAREARHNHVQHDAPFDIQYRIRHGDGTYRWFRTRGKVLRNDDGAPIRFTGSITDITEGKRHQQQLKAENAWLAKFAEGAPLRELLDTILQTARDVFETAVPHVWLLDGEAELHVFPDAEADEFEPARLRELLAGVPLDDLVMAPGSNEWPRRQGDLAFDRMHVWSLAARGVPQKIGFALSYPHRVPEQPHERQFIAAALRLAGLAMEGVRQEAELDRQRLLFRDLFESAPEAMVVMDRSERVLDVNSAFTRLFQYEHDEAVGRKLNELLVPPEFEQEGRRLSEQALRGSNVSKESFRRRRDGTLVPVSILGAPVTVTGLDAAYFAVYRDQRSLHEAAERLDHQARHDQLTGLPNRYEFERRLEQAMDLSGEAMAPVGVVYFDLDQFKVINDSSGHMRGDELLQEIAMRLRTLVKAPDVFARLGGDEFGVLLVNGSQDDCEELARRVRECLAAESFRLGERTFVITASFGIVAVTPPAKLDAHDVLSLADSACFLAKERGRNRVQVFDPGDTGVARRQEELDWVSRLNDALAEGRFELYYQRIEPVAGEDRSMHYEILLRMTGRNGEKVPPGVFIPPAERYNLMPRVDRWVLQTVFTRLATLDRASQEQLVASVNISGNTLSDESLPDFVRQLFETHEVLPSCICFEITETAAIGNFEDALNFIDTVRQLGCQVALDDFGSGLSSFRYLKQISPDYLKIDGSFVREIANNRTDFSMVEAINRIGKTVGIRTVAEFVEDEETLDALRQIGVDYAQGYGVHRPEPWLLHSPLKRAQG